MKTTPSKDGKKAKSISSFFGKDALQATAGVKRKAAAVDEGEWMAADERSQLEKALKLSLLEIETPSSSTGGKAVKSEGENEEATLPVASTSALKSSDERKAEEVGAAMQKTSSLAPLFSAAKDPSIPQEPTPPPIFNDSDFASQSSVVHMNRFSSSLDCLYWRSYLSPSARSSLLHWMLDELAWHRVSYVRPGGMRINTPRFTTTFGIDDSGQPIHKYKIKPKPIPAPLLELKRRIEEVQAALPVPTDASAEVDVEAKPEAVTKPHYNALIINYYSSGSDSISYHSDDESFLGPNPNIASLSLGATRDFYLRRKLPLDSLSLPLAGSKSVGPASSRPTEKLQLTDGALLIMRGRTQAEWEHSIPKRANLHQGRINITFRRAMGPRAIDNFTHYNRGSGAVWRWDGKQMVEGKGGI